MLVYLAQPIDQAKGAQHNVGGITHTLRTVGVHWYRPAGAFGLNGETTQQELSHVDKINRFALGLADALVAWLPPRVPTLGTPSEIEYSLTVRKPTIILTDFTLMNTSVQLTNWASRGAVVLHWDDALARKWESNPEELLRHLRSAGERVGQTYGGGFYDEYAAAANTTEHSLMCANHGDCGAERISENLTLRLDALEEQFRARLRGGTTDRLLAEPAPWATHEVSEYVPELEVLRAGHQGGAFHLPARAHHDDAGLDLAITNTETLEVGECRMLPTGIRAALPTGFWGLIIGRSSTWVKHRCDVRHAVIDPGYRGELMIQLDNRSGTRVTFPAGSRLAQYVLLPSFAGTVTEVDELPPADRGENGYGSSGA